MLRKGGAYLVLLAVLLVSACGPRKISRDEMQDIIYEMLLQDQQIKINRDLKLQADTSLVYEGIFNAYGYDTDDFIYSLSHYLEDASDMEKIMGKVAERLEKDTKAVGKELDLIHWRERMLAIYNMQPDTTLPRPRPSVLDSLPLRFSKDSVWLDTLFRHPADTSAAVVDSLSVPADSLAAQADSLAAPADSLVAHKDSLTIPLDSPILAPAKPL